MAENTNYQSESSLPVITTVDEIDHFRIINKNGQSQKATIAQVRELIPYVGENLVANSTMSSGAWYWFPSQYAMPIMVDIIKGRQYTVSFDVVGVDANDLVSLFMTATYGNEGGQHLLNLQVSQTGKRVSTTFIAAENFVKGSVLSFRGHNGIGGTFRDIKLELGTKATPYTPNPADIARAIDYSKLEEQIVPGYFFAHHDTGKPLQVYVQTVKRTFPNTLNAWTSDINHLFRFYFQLVGGFNSSKGLLECVGVVGIEMVGNIAYKGAAYQLSRSNGGIDLVCNQASPEAFAGKTFYITLLYTKA